MARPIHAISRICDRITVVACGVDRKAGSATTARKIRFPAMTAAAAKCIARMRIKGPSIPAPSQSMGWPLHLLTDLKRETAVSRMRVHRKNAPRHVVCPGTAWTQRHRHLAAADTRFAGIDTLTGSVGHSDGAERGLQLLSKPQHHLARRCRDLVADTRLCMVEKRVR